MINLAGNTDADRTIRRELDRARIPVIEMDRRSDEVSASLGGELGVWKFGRAWYYWIASAPEGRGLPIELARELYSDHVGRTDIRVGGHCGCPSPDQYGATYLDSDGCLLVAEKERANFEHYIEHGFIGPEALTGKRFTPDPKTDFAYATVDLYHIDSELGLRLFADALRSGQVYEPALDERLAACFPRQR
jgi:hypothetical protein